MKISIFSTLAVSTLAMSTLASSTITNNVHEKTLLTNTTLNKQTLKNQNSVPLFNNKYGFLSQDSWITNQSTADNNYYSYDTSHAVGALSDGTLTRNAFIVDSSGNLTIDSSLKLNDTDKILLNNIQSEMIRDKQVTVTQDNYDPYSTSIYNSAYFKDSKWQFLQMGGIENHINISSQSGANKVENNSNLSEDFGLYYIAKAVRQTGGIDMSVADNLGQSFINQSALKGQINEKLTNEIISLLVTNDDVYNWCSPTSSLPFNNDSPKYSLNFIFDNNNNLIELYYKQWDKDLLKPIAVGNNLDASVSVATAGAYGWHHNDSKTFLITWKDLKVNNYNQFLQAFSSISFHLKSCYFRYKNNYGDDIIYSNLSNKTFNYQNYVSCFTSNWTIKLINTNRASIGAGAGGDIKLYTMHTDQGIAIHSWVCASAAWDWLSGGHYYSFMSVDYVSFN